MNIFQKVTLQALKKNRTRTIVTIIGIILSASMICAVTSGVYGIQKFLLNNSIYREGNWHGSETGADGTVLQMLDREERVEEVTYATQLGYAIAEGCKNPDKPYLYVLGATEGFEEMMSLRVTEGKFPTEQSEILLPAHLKSNGGVSYNLGDVLTLELGVRDLNGYVLGQNNPYHPYDEAGNEVPLEDSLTIRDTRKYTVVGFYERPSFEDRFAPGYTALTYMGETTGEETYDIYFRMENPKDCYAFVDEKGLTGTINEDVLLYAGASKYDGFTVMLYGLAAVVIGLIMFGSVSLIYNAFSISVSERTKQFGLLSSLGATKKQLRKMVLFEAFAVSVIGVPLGVFFGIAGIGITFFLISDRITLMGETFPVPLRVSVSPTAVLIACIVALVTVLISAWIPSKRVTRMSALEAIRQSKDIQVTRSGIGGKVAYRLFGLPGMLASKHFKRNRKKYRATVVSLFTSIVLFVSTSAFTEYLMESAQFGFGIKEYDITYNTGNLSGQSITEEELLERLSSAEGVTRGVYYVSYSAWCEVPTEILTKQWLADAKRGDSGVTSEVQLNVMLIDDTGFRELLRENGLDEKAFLNEEAPRAVVFDRYRVYDSEKEKFLLGNMLAKENVEIRTEVPRVIDGYYVRREYTNEAGEQIYEYASKADGSNILTYTRDEVYTERTFLAGTVIEDAAMYTEAGAGITLFYPRSFTEFVLPEEKGGMLHYRFCSEDHAVSYTEMKNILEENDLGTTSLTDWTANAEDNRNTVTVIRVFAYGFIVLISLIAAANVFNTISTNISLRRREFAMLKSVGMTGKGFRKMMNFECLLYGSKALLYGLPVSVGVTYLIHLAVSAGYTMGFRLPWAAMGIAILSVFAVVFITMMYSMGKIKNDNPMEALRSENL